jgi:excinuclease ABC subunit C
MSMLLEKIKKFPASPGIYLFYDKKRELIYVGKATSLRDRVRSYFALSPLAHLGPARPVEAMIHEVADIKIIKTDSVLEAVILEGNYIKKFLPKYNVDWKDDKSWNYLVITNERFPKLVAIREREMKLVTKNWKLEIGNWKFIFGPFPSLNTRETLKVLHKLFYISRCQPFPLPLIMGGLGRGRSGKPCFDYQLGHCLGVCVGEISAHDYEKKVIRPLAAFLSGEKKRLIKNLNSAMKIASKNENFEEAARLRNQVNALKHIQDMTLLNKEFIQKVVIPNPPAGGEGSREKKDIKIEAYDISNLGDSGKVGSMIVFDENGPIKNDYRKFKIKTVAGQSDVDCLKEILTRRLLHTEWQLPNLILVDGGIPQINAIESVLIENKINLPVIPIIGIAKGQTRKKNEFIFGKNSGIWQNWVLQNGNLLIQARDEAHRFAINYQKKLREIKNLSK